MIYDRKDAKELFGKLTTAKQYRGKTKKRLGADFSIDGVETKVALDLYDDVAMQLLNELDELSNFCDYILGTNKT